jgi:hypothetical protein
VLGLLEVNEVHVSVGASALVGSRVLNQTKAGGWGNGLFSAKLGTEYSSHDGRAVPNNLYNPTDQKEADEKNIYTIGPSAQHIDEY